MRRTVGAVLLMGLMVLAMVLLGPAPSLHAANKTEVFFGPKQQNNTRIEIPKGGSRRVVISIDLTVTEDDLAPVEPEVSVSILGDGKVVDQFDIPLPKKNRYDTKLKAGDEITLNRIFVLSCRVDTDDQKTKVKGRIAFAPDDDVNLEAQFKVTGPTYGKTRALCVDAGAVKGGNAGKAVLEPRSLAKEVLGNETNVLEELYECPGNADSTMRQAAYEIRSLVSTSSISGELDEFPSSYYLNGEFQARLLVRQRLPPLPPRGHFEGPWAIISRDEHGRVLRIAEGRMLGTVVAGTHAGEEAAPKGHFEGVMTGTMVFGPGNPKQLRATVQGTGLATPLGVALGDFSMRMEGVVEINCQPTGIALLQLPKTGASRG